jgi:hypothetical protein
MENSWIDLARYMSLGLLASSFLLTKGKHMPIQGSKIERVLFVSGLIMLVVSSIIHFSTVGLQLLG